MIVKHCLRRGARLRQTMGSTAHVCLQGPVPLPQYAAHVCRHSFLPICRLQLTQDLTFSMLLSAASVSGIFCQIAAHTLVQGLSTNMPIVCHP